MPEGSIFSDARRHQTVAHAPVYGCDGCDRTSGSQGSLDQQMSSSAHAPLYEYDKCDWWFGSVEAL